MEKIKEYIVTAHNFRGYKRNAVISLLDNPSTWAAVKNGLIDEVVYPEVEAQVEAEEEAEEKEDDK